MEKTSAATNDFDSKKESDELHRIIAEAHKEIKWLHEVISSYRRRQYGKKNEAWHSPEQFKLFNEAEMIAIQSASESSDDPENRETETITYERKKPRKRGKRGPLPKHLERRVVEVELPPNKRLYSACKAA
jgi:hypothetical protein